jgi:hypothetical protein
MATNGAQWTARQKHPRVLRESGARICDHGVAVGVCHVDHSRCRDCEKEFEDCLCYLDAERTEAMRAQFRIVR